MRRAADLLAFEMAVQPYEGYLNLKGIRVYSREMEGGLVAWTAELTGRRPGGDVEITLEFDWDLPMFGKKPGGKFWKRRDGAAEILKAK